jgi:hypothetical protein
MKLRLLSAPILVAMIAGTLPGQQAVKTFTAVGPSVRPRVKQAATQATPAAAPTPADTAGAAATALALLPSPGGYGPLLAAYGYHTFSQRASIPESPRLARLNQLQFDRRPSTILKAWSKRDEPKTTSPKGPPKTTLDLEMEKFQQQVTRGDWVAVRAYFAKLPGNEGKAAYKQLLQSLQATPNAPAGGFPGRMIRGFDGNLMPPQRPELNAFTTEDVIGLIAAAPDKLDQELTNGLAALLKRVLEGSTILPDVVARFKKETDQPKDKGVLNARRAALLFMATGEPAAAGTFLPSQEQAIKDKDAEGLNLLARHLVGVHAKEKKAVFLERAWSATQAVLEMGTGKEEELDEALKRAVELASQIKQELGQAWLDQSFTSHPERGMRVLATVGALASQGLDSNPMEREERLKILQLLKTAVDALLKASPQLALQWHDSLALAAGAWMREAEYTRQMDNTSKMGYRSYRRGRFYYSGWYGDPDQMLRQQNLPLPIHSADLLRARPEKTWLANLDAGPRVKFSDLLAHLYLKDNDEKSAFPFIEAVVPADKGAGRDLVNEFLAVWTASHDLNSAKQDNDSMYYNYGFFTSVSGSADSIPLTRSKQERNLVDLADWVEKFRRMPLDNLDEDLLVNAFTKCHSSAEVYRLDAIEKVFGPLAKIKPKTLATLIQTTRANLGGVWREPAEQAKQKTNRKQQDIKAEVLRGYELAATVVGDALKQYADDWSLNLAKAALLHDETNYRQEVAKSTDFSKKREEAIAGFQRAAALYGDQVKKLSQDEETIAPYQQWFSASLGASDITHIDGDKLPDPRQAPLIRNALLALPGQTAERHLDKMAKALVSNLGAVKPAARYRYLKHGFEIVGDNKHAADAKKTFDYYKDIVHEIKLDAVIDGGDRVGHKQPFGVFVNIRHTREIERESGGFGRYLQNQNNSGYFSYNYGRPTADYRDRFQAVATDALKENFDIVSVTFQTEKVHSHALPEYGWRVTPYAYMLLKPRGPQVDKIPPLRLDLDFQDVADYSDARRATGYVILPVESPAVPIDATSEKGEPRPVRKLQITQILDERQADKGKLGLEIKATGIGLVGALDEILSLAPAGFEIAQSKDQGVSVAKYDEEAIAVVSERTWLVDLHAKQDQAAAPATFRFGSPKLENTEMVYQRYQDADLATAQPEVELEHEYRGGGNWWPWVAGIASAALGLILLTVLVRVFVRRPQPSTPITLPEKIDPFTVTLLLQRIRRDRKLAPADQEALEQTIGKLERDFFAEANGNGEKIDLRKLTEDWVRKVS